MVTTPGSGAYATAGATSVEGAVGGKTTTPGSPGPGPAARVQLKSSASPGAPRTFHPMWKPKKPSPRTFALGGALFLGAILLGVVRGGSDGPKEVELSAVLSAIDAGDIVEASLDDANQTVEVTLDDDATIGDSDEGAVLRTSYPVLYGTDLIERLEDNDIKFSTDQPVGASTIGTLLMNLLPVFMIIGFLLFFMRGKLGMAGIGKSNASQAVVPDTRFSDVAGIDEVVEELQEVADYLHRPERFVASGARVPHGFLLVGPAGTGKTLLARAVAGEAGVPFFALSGSDFVETFVGVGASRVRDVFAKARKHERAIIFIDEIDAVGKARTAGPSNGSSEERENTLNALLVEMDGFAQSNLIVLGATNRDDVLDPALTRPGRFDRTISVHAPDRHGRTELLELYMRRHRMAPDVDLVAFARRTPGLTGADISALVNDAALEAVRRDEEAITTHHLEAALATSVLGRERRSRVISEEDRQVTAWHEAGHTVAALMQPAAEDPIQVTIVPRGFTGGVTWMSGSDSPYLTRSKAIADLVVAMSGRAAEELLLAGDFTQGASGDLSSATKLATDMVTHYGMGDGGIAALNTGELFGAQAERVHTEIDRLLAVALGDARTLLARERALLVAVAAGLLDTETLHIEELYVLRDELHAV